MNLKLIVSVVLIIIFNYTILSADDKIADEDWHFIASATGKTTGHIGDLIITNKTNTAKTITPGFYFIPPEKGKQGFAVFNDAIKKIEVLAGDTYEHQLFGYCINIDLSPPKKGEAFPSYSQWLLGDDFDTAYAELWHNDKVSSKILNITKDSKLAASVILKAVENLEQNYYTWKDPLQIPDIYPGNAKAVKEGIIQQAVWQFASALQGDTYSFNTFEQGILQQASLTKWMNSNGAETATIEGQPINNRTYFNYQCQYLWDIINELNYYVNPASRKLIPKRKMNIGKIEAKNIEFQDAWENVALIGSSYKVEEAGSTDTTPNTIVKDFLKGKWPYAAVGVGVVTATALLWPKKVPGCTDASACNFDEDANKDDGSCKFAVDCLGVCGGNTLAGTFCNSRRGKFNDNCECEDRSFNDFVEGSLKFCEEDTTVKLIEIDGNFFEPVFDLVQEEFACSNTNSSLSERQIIKFDFYETGEEGTCNDESTKKIMLTSLELVTPGTCNFKSGSVSKLYAVPCLEIGQSLIVIDTYPQYFIIPKFECSEIHQRLNSFINELDGTEVVDIKIDYEAFNYESPCDDTFFAVITCFEIDSTILKKTPDPYYKKGFKPLVENRIITTPVLNSEYPEITLITNVLGVQYNQPVTPTIFIENQSLVAYLQVSNLYFLNNKITLNAKNPHLPIHYGLGFNSIQLTEIPGFSNWQNELIWNVGMKVPVFKIFQLEAEVFKSFDIEDAPNYTIRLIYTKGKDNLNLKKE